MYLFVARTQVNVVDSIPVDSNQAFPKLAFIALLPGVGEVFTSVHYSSSYVRTSAISGQHWFECRGSFEGGVTLKTSSCI